MKLGAFSISLAVKDLQASLAFYQKLGFQIFAGNAAQHYLILKNEHTVIGLFEGMFEQNILTFNPGWNQEAQELAHFEDVRELHQQAVAHGLSPMQANVEGSSGPGSFVLVDPDGNPVLIDQHV